MAKDTLFRNENDKNEIHQKNNLRLKNRIHEIQQDDSMDIE